MPKIQQRTVSIPIATNKILTSSGYQNIFTVTTNKLCFKIVAASKFDAIYIVKKFFPEENITSLI